MPLVLPTCSAHLSAHLSYPPVLVLPTYTDHLSYPPVLSTCPTPSVLPTCPVHLSYPSHLLSSVVLSGRKISKEKNPTTGPHIADTARPMGSWAGRAGRLWLQERSRLCCAELTRAGPDKALAEDCIWCPLEKDILGWRPKVGGVFTPVCLGRRHVTFLEHVALEEPPLPFQPLTSAVSCELLKGGYGGQGWGRWGVGVAGLTGPLFL